MVMAQALFASLKMENPGCVIDVLTPPATFPLLARMAEEGRVHRELVRCGRTSAIDLASPSSLRDPQGRIAHNPLAPR